MVDPWSNSIHFTYDTLGRVHSIQVNSGEVMAYDYDTDGRLSTVTAGSRVFTYTYTGGNPVPDQLQRPNGSVTFYSYDNLYRLLEIANKTNAGVVINGNAFTYDKAHMKTKEVITNGGAPGYLTNKTFAFNNVNQLTSTGYSYDADGNMTSFKTPDGYAATATYDAENRLKTVSYTDLHSVQHNYAFTYNADGLIAKQVIDGVETRFVRAGYLILQERDASNNVTRSYVWDGVSPGGIGGLLELTQGGQHYDYLYDGKGNVNALIDASQAVVVAYRYDTFGNLISKSGTLDQPYQFSTKRCDAGTGIIIYEYRPYLPIVAKWMTHDPLGEEGGENLYEPMGNNASNYIDPTGEIRQRTTGRGATAVGMGVQEINNWATLLSWLHILKYYVACDKCHTPCPKIHAPDFVQPVVCPNGCCRHEQMMRCHPDENPAKPDLEGPVPTPNSRPKRGRGVK